MPNFSWQKGLLPDPMHNISNVCKMLLRCLVGFKTSCGALYAGWGRLTDSKHRAECELLGVFPSVWRGAPMPWRLNGMDHKQVRTNSHTTYTHSTNTCLHTPTPTAPRHIPTLILSHAYSLTYQVENRSMALVYPHYTEVVSLQRKSYWSKSSAIWKMSQKKLVMLVLMPTTLRGLVPLMHKAICRIAEGMRLIDGQAMSLNRSRRLCIPPGMLAGI